MEPSRWASDGIDVRVPSVADMYDHLLGSIHGFAAAADRIRASFPDVPLMVEADREFLRRAVQHCVDAGITQFVDLGTGLASRNRLRELTQSVNPQVRVVYVDTDPVTVLHCRMMLRGDDRATVVRADLREPDEVLSAPGVTEYLDFSQPVGLLMVAVMHFVPNSDSPADTISRYADRLAPGSCLVLSHATEDGRHRESADMYQRLMTNMTMRSRTEIEALFGDFDLVEPGVTWLEDWRPEPDHASRTGLPTRFAYGGVGRKPLLATPPRRL